MWAGGRGCTAAGEQAGWSASELAGQPVLGHACVSVGEWAGVSVGKRATGQPRTNAGVRAACGGSWIAQGAG